MSIAFPHARRAVSATARGALSDIYCASTILDELQQTLRFNGQVGVSQFFFCMVHRAQENCKTYEGFYSKIPSSYCKQQYDCRVGVSFLQPLSRCSGQGRGHATVLLEGMNAINIRFLFMKTGCQCW